MHLGHATQRVRVLHLVAVLVTVHDLAVRKQRAQVARNHDLPRMGTHGHDPLVKRPHRSLERFEAHGTSDVGITRERRGLQKRYRTKRSHHLRAVDERQPLLGLQLDRLEPDPSQRLTTGQNGAIRARFAFPLQHECKVGQRCKIARSADRALRRDPRVHLPIEHLHQQLDQLHANAGMPQREHLRTQHRHGTDRRNVEQGTDRTGVAPHQVALQRPDVIGVDTCLAQCPKARVHPINIRRVVTADHDGLHRSPRTLHAIPRMRRENDGPPTTRDIVDRSERDGLPQLDGGLFLVGRCVHGP